MASEFKYQHLSAFDGVLLILTEYEMEQLDAFFEHSKVSLKLEEKYLKQRVASSSRGEDDLDDWWVDDFAQLEEFAWLSSEFAIVGLWRCVELYRKDAIRHALGPSAVQGIFIHKEFQKKLRSQGIEESQICCAEHMDELRCLNNAIKHERRVSNELAAKFLEWKGKEGEKLGDLERHYHRLQPLAKQYLEDLAKRLKAQFPPLHRVKNMKRG